MEGESELVTTSIWFYQHSEQGLTREDFRSFLTLIHLMKYAHHSGTKYKCYQDFIREKKPMSGEKLSQPYFSCPIRRPVHQENCFPSLGWSLLSRSLPISDVSRQKISRKGKTHLFIWRYWHRKNNAILDVEVKQIIIVQVSKWSLTTRLQRKQGPRTDCDWETEQVLMSAFGFLTPLKHIYTSETKFVEVRYNLSHRYIFMLLGSSLCYLRNMSVFHMQMQTLFFQFFS